MEEAKKSLAALAARNDLGYDIHLTVSGVYAVAIDEENPWLPPLLLTAMSIDDQPTITLTIKDDGEEIHFRPNQIEDLVISMAALQL